MQINENNDVQAVYDVSVKMSADLEPAHYTKYTKEEAIEFCNTNYGGYDSINEAIAGLSAGDSVHCRCATVQENGKLKTYEIDFRLLEDKSGEY